MEQPVRTDHSWPASRQHLSTKRAAIHFGQAYGHARGCSVTCWMNSRTTCLRLRSWAAAWCTQAKRGRQASFATSDDLSPASEETSAEIGSPLLQLEIDDEDTEACKYLGALRSFMLRTNVVPAAAQIVAFVARCSSHHCASRNAWHKTVGFSLWIFVRDFSTICAEPRPYGGQRLDMHCYSKVAATRATMDGRWGATRGRKALDV